MPTPNRDSSTSSRDVRKFKIAGKGFVDRQAAVDWLRGNDTFVKKNAYDLYLKHPKAFQQAGYRIVWTDPRKRSFRLEKAPSREVTSPTPRGETRTYTRFGEYKPIMSSAVDRTGKQPKQDIAKVSGQVAKETAPARGGGRTAGAAGAGPASSGVFGMPQLPSIDISGISGLDPNTGVIIPTSMADDGASLFNAPALAKTLAGMEFDPAIADIVAAQGVTGRQNKQNEADVANWYSQVLGSQETARGRDAAIGKAATGSVQDAAQAIISSLGGSANEGAGMVGAAGEAAVGTLGALGAAQDQYNADIRPLLQAEKAGSLSRERALGSNRIHDLAVKLASARGQKGQAQAAKQFEIQQANNQVLDNRLQARLGIMQANNATRQQRFNNAFGVEQAKVAAAVSGGQLVNDVMKSLAGSAGEAESRTVPYAKASQSLRDDAYASFEERAATLKAAGYTAQDALRAAGTFFPAGYGWSMKNPAVANLARTAVRAVFGV